MLHRCILDKSGNCCCVPPFAAKTRRQAASLRDFVAPRATLKRRRTRLSSTESQRLERLARIVAMTEEVWQDKTAAAEFLTRPLRSLGGRTPLQMATTDLGARQVEELLASIEFGLPA